MNNWAAFWAGPNRWARNHPWQWAAVGAVAWFVGGRALTTDIWVGLLTGALGFLVTGWSVSRGPGRRFLGWRLRGRP